MNAEAGLPQMRPPLSTPVLGGRRTTTSGFSGTAAAVSSLNNAGNAQVVVVPLRLLTDADVETLERQRWGRLVQEGWFHQSVHCLRWDREMMLRGSSYRTRSVAARTAVRTTVTAALVLGLNIDLALWMDDGGGGGMEIMDGPPLPPPPAAEASRLYMWHSPALLPGYSRNILSELGQQLERQYKSLSKRSLMVCHCLNARPADLAHRLSQCREHAGSQNKVIFHYGGYGVPRPRGGSLFLLPPSGEPVKFPLSTLHMQVGFPFMMVADCANAGSILYHFLESRQKSEDCQDFTYRQYDKTVGASTLGDPDRSDMLLSGRGMYDGAASVGVDGAPANTSGGCSCLLPRLHGLNSGPTSPVPPLLRDDFFFIGATDDGELPHHPKLPSDILTSCLTTPVQMALLWFIVENSRTANVHPLLLHLIPGTLEDKKTPLGQLHWAFVSITECIAWSSLTYPLFVHLFREDVVVAPLFRGFLLAERIIIALGGAVSVYPPLPRMNRHPMWDTLNNIIDRTLVSLHRSVLPAPPTALTPLEFREWLDWNVTKWRYEQGSMTLPSLECRSAVVPNFLGEELRSFSAVVERITEQSFSRLTHDCRQQQQQREEQQSAGYFYRLATAPSQSQRGALKDNPLLFLRGRYRGYSGGGGKGRNSEANPFLSMLRMPMLLQGLLVVAHRDKATELVCRLVDAGPPAVAACAEVGIFNVALIHYWGRPDLRYLLPTLLFIYTKACYTDPSLADITSKQRDEIVDACVELLEHPARVPDESTAEPGAWQSDILGGWVDPEGQQLLAAALLAMLCLHSGEVRRRSRGRDALRVCCDLLRKAAAKAPQLSLLHQVKKKEEEAATAAAAATESGSSDNFWDDFPSNGLESDSVRASRYALCLIALLVSLSWEGVISSSSASSAAAAAANADGMLLALPSDDDDDDNNNNSNTGDDKNNVSVRERLASALKTLRLLLCAASSAVRGASLRAITLIMVSSLTDERTALRCICIIGECTAVRRPPQEGSTDIRLEFVGALFVAIQWLTERLSASMSIEQIRQMLHRESKRIYHAMMGAHGHCYDDHTRIQETTEPTAAFAFPPSCCCFSPSSPYHATVRGGGGVGSRDEYLLGKLAWLTCQLAILTHDPCPYVASHACKVLEDDLSQLHVRRLLFFRPADTVAGVRACSTANSRNSGIANFFSGVLSSFTSRGGKLTSRGDSRQCKRELRSGDDDDDSGHATDAAAAAAAAGGGGGGYYGDYGTAQGVELVNAGCVNASARMTVVDMDPPLQTVSIHDSSTISSFLFAILSFLGDLMLVPLDDDDPRSCFNLEKDARIHRYLRQLRGELRPSTLSGSGFRVQTDGVSASPLLPPTPSAWSHSSSFMAIPSHDDDTRGHTPVLSPLMKSSSGSCPDVSLAATRDRDSPFQLLTDKNTFSERNGHVQVLAFHSTERHFITGTDQGVIQVWSFADAEGLLPFSSTYNGPSSFSALSAAAAAATPLAVASTTTTTTTTATAAVNSPSGEVCRLLAQFHVLEMMMRPEATVPCSALMQYMYSTQQDAPRAAGTLGMDSSGQRPGMTLNSAARRLGSLSHGDEGIRGLRGVEPLTGLHLVDAAYRTLLCAVGRSGSVYLFSAYTNEGTVRRVTSFATMTQEESLRSHQCLSSYHAPAMLLHVSGADGTIASWDLNCEHKVLNGAGCGELLCSPSALASHPSDVFSFAVGARSVFLYDLRNPSRATHILPDPTALGKSLQEEGDPQRQQCRRRLGDYSPLCLHIGFSCRYAHGVVTGYGGEHGVVMLWDDRNLGKPIHQVLVFDAEDTSCSALNSVCYMDVQHYHHSIMTMSVTADALLVGDALGPPSVAMNRSHLRLKHQCSAAALHPVLPLCGVASGGSVQLYGRKRAPLSG